MIKERNSIVCILLSIVTCGIYGIYWEYSVLSDLYMSTNQPNKAATDILLTIVTCGIYGIYLYYKMGDMVNQAHIQHGLPAKNDSVLYLLLGIFGLGIIVFVLVQNDLNDNLAYVVNNNIIHTNTEFDNSSPYTADSADHPTNYGYQDDSNNPDDNDYQ